MGGSKRARVGRKAKDVKKTGAAIAKLAVGYVSVSADEQASSGSEAMQEAAIRAFARRQGYELLQVISDLSCRTPAQREGFARVVELAAASAFSVLIVWRLDRLGRRIEHAVTAANGMHEM